MFYLDLDEEINIDRGEQPIKDIDGMKLMLTMICWWIDKTNSDSSDVLGFKVSIITFG